MKFRMPLHAKAESSSLLLYSLNYAITGAGVDYGRWPDLCNRLMVGAIHFNFVYTDDIAKDCSSQNIDAVPGLISRVRLFMSESTCDLVRDVLDQAAAKRNIQQLFASTDS